MQFRIPSPSFDSSLTTLIIDLDHLRRKSLQGSTPVHTFFELKKIFHLMESLGSARIEGNNTTIAEVIESKREPSIEKSEKLLEIENLENTLSFLDELPKIEINRSLISEIHKRLTEGLTPPPPSNRGGSRNPGIFRSHNVTISGSKHIPPDYTQINSLMEEMFESINMPQEGRYDLLKIAISHHYFTYIHPFDNGNGRAVRLFTYSMLIKFGFRVNISGRILNPTAIFCNNRNAYYDKLSNADTLTDEGLLDWCEYVLKGLKEEIEKIDKLTDYVYLSSEILIPALRDALDNKYINNEEYNILIITIKKGEIVAGDLKELYPNSEPYERSRIIGKLKEKGMLQPIGKESTRRYGLKVIDNYLTRSVITLLGKNDFLPIEE